jgi:hypothetical protein
MAVSAAKCIYSRVLNGHANKLTFCFYVSRSNWIWLFYRTNMGLITQMSNDRINLTNTKSIIFLIIGEHLYHIVTIKGFGYNTSEHT